MTRPAAKRLLLFSRCGEDIHGSAFEHRLFYSEFQGRWKAWVESRDLDENSKSPAESWDEVTDVDALLRVMMENLYLSMSRVEVVESLLPALRKPNPDLARHLESLLDRGEIVFPGDEPL